MRKKERWNLHYRMEEGETEAYKGRTKIWYCMCNPVNPAWSPGSWREKCQIRKQELKREVEIETEPPTESLNVLTDCPITEPINQRQQINSAWHEYLLIIVNIKHSYVHLLKGTAAGQSLVHSVPEGPFVHFGVMYCPQLECFSCLLFPIFSILASKVNILI